MTKQAVIATSQQHFAIDLPMDQIKSFCERWQIIEFALFGSVLRDDFRPDSDVDVLVTVAPEFAWTLSKAVQRQEEIEAVFGRKVDFVERRNVERSFNYIRRKEILKTAQVIYVQRQGLST